MFELFKKWLPAEHFSTANWRSNIRHQVSVHDNYQDLQPWNGVETADIVYEDVHGGFTADLARMVGVPAEVFEGLGGRPVKYYFEVKTTLAECKTAFWMTKAQTQRVSLPFDFLSQAPRQDSLSDLTK